MNAKIIDENDNTLKYVVMVNGKEVTPKCMSLQAAETLIAQLSESDQAIAQVVLVTEDGKQLLWD